MWEVDIYMEKVKQDFQHAGVVQMSHVCVAQLCKEEGGPGPTEEQMDVAFALYEELVSWGQTQLNYQSTADRS